MLQFLCFCSIFFPPSSSSHRLCLQGSGGRQTSPGFVSTSVRATKPVPETSFTHLLPTFPTASFPGWAHFLSADCLCYLDRWNPFSGFSQLVNNVAANVTEVLQVKSPTDDELQTWVKPVEGEPIRGLFPAWLISKNPMFSSIRTRGGESNRC